ncbi:MAG TPA: hypothetical protein VM869_13830, partial [Enhygromyxa sp.]|nr:hypothetical protein [Enhygromyxa sp.]
CAACAKAAHRRVLLAHFAFDRPKSRDEQAKERALLWLSLADNMASNPELKVTLIAEFTGKPDDEGRDEVLVSCDVPPVTAGTWTLEFGGTEVPFEIGTSGVHDMACAVSNDQQRY